VDAHNYYVTIESDPKEGVQTMSGVCLAYSAAACNHHVDTSASQYVTWHFQQVYGSLEHRFLIVETTLLHCWLSWPTAVTALYFIFTYGPRLDREWNNVTGVNKLVFEHNFEMLCTASMFAVHAVWMFCSIMLLLWPLFITIDAIFMAYWNRSVGIQ